MERKALCTGIRNFNHLEPDMKTMNPKKLKSTLKTRKLGPDKGG